MAETIVPIGPGPESVSVELWAAGPSAGRWDRGVWDGAQWGALAWQAIGCDVSEAASKWGASQEAGILSVAEAGELDLRTYDPGRQLDPLNASSPFYGYVRPGTPVRLSALAPGAMIAGTGLIDEAAYDLASSVGRIRALDGIAYLSQAQVPDATALPNTLRARARAVVAACGLGSIVPVEPDPGATVERLANGSFDNGLTGWAPQPASGQWSVVVDQASPAGPNVARVLGDGVTAYPGLRQTVAAVPGALYTFAALYRSAGATAQVVIRLDAMQPDGNLTTGLYLANGNAGGQADYTAASGTYTVPADGSIDRLSAFVYIGTGTAGQDVRVDGLSLRGPAEPVLADPAVAPFDGKAAPAWRVISDAALDALTYVWIDPTGLLRFRSWSAFADAVLSVGCPPDDASGETWLEGVSTVGVAANANAIRNRVRAYSAGTTWQAPASDPISVARYGPRPFDIERVVPGFAAWAAAILADRSDAGLELGVGEIRPYTVAELAALVQLGLDGPATVHVRDDAHGTLVELDTGMVGASLGVTPAGWRWQLTTMLSRVDWDAITPEPPVPPIPPADAWHVETRTYVASSDALIALTSGGSKYGAGAASSIPFGTWQGWTYRGLLKLPSIPTTKIRAVRSATLRLTTSDQVRVGFGSSPKVQMRRITGSWSAGSSSSPSSGNSVVWPGPATTSSGAVTAAVTRSQNAGVSIRCDAIARAWYASSAGGSQAAQYGIALYEASSSGSNTGEIWPLEHGGSTAPALDIVLEVFD